MSHVALRVIREEHATLAAMLQSLQRLLERGHEVDGGEGSTRYFDVLRAMLFYIDEFPQKQHHPKESDLLFVRLLPVAPHLQPTIDQLERDHRSGETQVRDLMHLLLAWELLGDGRRRLFMDEVGRYIDFYLAHMRVEEEQILPEAERALTEADWHVLNAAFATNQNPLSARIPRDPQFDRLFTRIVMQAPAPVGLGG